MTHAAKKPTRSRLPGLTVRDGYTPHPFDLEYGVRTSGLVAGRHLKSGHPHEKHATAYYGVAPSVLTALIRRWRRTQPAAPITETTFIDVGAGMGRGVLVASQLPFRAVVGVELHPGLARIARRNLSLWRKAERAVCPVRLIEGDAVELELPSGAGVAFLFNPFGAAVLRKLLRAWQKQLAASAASLDILYVNNEQEHVLEAIPRLRTALQRQNSALPHRRHRRPQDHGQPARRRIRLRQLRRLLHLALDRLETRSPTVSSPAISRFCTTSGLTVIQSEHRGQHSPGVISPSQVSKSRPAWPTASL